MKMTQAQYQALRDAIEPLLPQYGRAYGSMRHRWDLLWTSKFDVTPFYKTGLNDNHIDTALRKIAD